MDRKRTFTSDGEEGGEDLAASVEESFRSIASVSTWTKANGT